MNPNIKQPVYLICGVSGSGKTWVCNQLRDKFCYIPHDEHFKDHEMVILERAILGNRPVLTECPFGERGLKTNLEISGLKVIPYFIIEDPRICAQRYFQRENKPIQKAAMTRATSIKLRALEWQAPWGTSKEILELLKKV